MDDHDSITSIKIDFTDVNQHIFLICAFKYALRRKTHYAKSVCDILISNWNNIPPHLKGKIKREIRDSIDNGYTPPLNSDMFVWGNVLKLDGDPHFGCEKVKNK
jgi:hypothetical protein